MKTSQHFKVFVNHLTNWMVNVCVLNRLEIISYTMLVFVLWNEKDKFYVECISMFNAFIIFGRFAKVELNVARNG